MTPVQPCEVPLHSFLRAYREGEGFADCYVTEVAGVVTQAAFVEAFYTSALFKVERTLLKVLASKSATDADARLLAAGQAARFSAWRVEARSASELLLADGTGRTRSWLQATVVEDDGSAAGETAGGLAGKSPRTRLYFGSAVVPRRAEGSATATMGWPFHALLGFHRLYSRLLLRAARRRLRAL